MSMMQRIERLERARRRERVVFAALVGAVLFVALGGSDRLPITRDQGQAARPLMSQATAGECYGDLELWPYFGALPDTLPGVRLADDLDGDGLCDLVLRNSAEQKFYIMRNTGLGSFQLVDEIDHPNNFIDTGDFDGDGQVDIVLGSTGTVGDYSAGIHLNLMPDMASCTGDLNDDQSVGIVDLVTVLSAWGPCR